MSEFLGALGDIEGNSPTSVLSKAEVLNAQWLSSMLVGKCGNITWYQMKTDVSNRQKKMKQNDRLKG